MKKKIIEFIILLVFVVVAFILWYVFLYKGNKTTFKDVQDKFEDLFVQSSRPTPSPFPTPIRIVYPLPSGKQGYNFSHGDGVTGPKIGKVYIDPLTPKNGENQTVTVTINNNSPVTMATAVLYTDNFNKSYPLKLIDGTTQKGTWSSSWKMNDSYNYVYKINFILKSPTGNWEGPLTFR